MHSAETEEGLRRLVLAAVPEACHSSIDWESLEILEECKL